MIPKTLKVGGHTIKVQYKLLHEENANFDYETNTITISTDLSESQMEASFIHELLHCCNSTMDSHDYGHAFLDSLAEQIYQILKENDICFCKKHML